MSSDFLKEVVQYKKKLNKKKEAFYEGLKRNTTKTKLTRYRLFREAISKPRRINLIAEIKKASPSQGLICKKFDALKIADTYVENKCDAISVLTEDKFFLGSFRYLRQVTDQFAVPVLTKDFIIEEGQVYEAFCFGASAILLIVAILSDEQLTTLMQIAARLDLDCLVEVHDEKELDRALHAKADIIGINHRNLRTLDVDLNVSEKLIPRIPSGKIIVAESGIKSHQDVLRLKELGAHAVLIGESFLRADDVGARLREIMYGDTDKRP